MPKFKTGDRVSVEGFECDGTVKFVGEQQETGKPRIGVALDEPLGKTKGKFQGHEYFKCAAKCGVLVPPKKVSAAAVVFFEQAPKEVRYWLVSETESI